ADLPRALRRPLGQPPLELRKRSRDEDRHRAGLPLGDGQRALGLELEDADEAFPADPVDLGVERARPLAPREDVVLEALAGREPPVELVVRDEVVVDAVLFARPACWC